MSSSLSFALEFVLIFFNRIAAINCLLSSMQIHDEADFSDVVLRSQIADVVFAISPGIFAKLSRVPVGDPKQGHTVIAVSLIRILFYTF